MEEEQLERERQQRAFEKRLKEQQKKLLGEARRKLRKTAEVCLCTMFLYHFLNLYPHKSNFGCK